MKKLLAYVLLALSMLCVALRPEAQEIRRPTAETTTSITAEFCSGAWYSGTLPNFWDAGGSATSSTQTSAGSATTNYRYKAAILSNFQAASRYSSLTLKVDWACNDIGGGGGCRISKSTDGGSTWSEVETVSSSNSAQHTIAVTLSPSQDVSLLRVKWEVCGSYDVLTEAAYSSTITGYDVRTEGTVLAKRKHTAGEWR